MLVHVARALHEGGLSADRLESSVHALAGRMGIDVEVFAAPTEVQLCFGDEREPRSHLLRVEPGGVDLGRMVRLQRWMDALPRRQPDIATSMRELAKLRSGSPRYGAVAQSVALVLATAGAACFFGAGLEGLLASSALAAVIAIVSVVLARVREAGSLFEPAAAFLVAFAAHGIQRRWDADAAIVTLSALIVLVPGFTLTVAIRELATRHLVAGTARLASAAMTFLGLGFGVALGQQLGRRWFGELGAVGGETLLPAGALFVSLCLSPLAFGVLFQARVRDLPLIAVVCWTGFLGAREGAAALGPELGVWLGALAVGVVSNVGSRLLRIPAAVSITPGIMLLVPGSLGFRSVSLFLTHDVVSGVEAAFGMVLVAVSLVGGLLFANVLVPPRRVF